MNYFIGLWAGAMLASLHPFSGRTHIAKVSTSWSKLEGWVPFIQNLRKLQVLWETKISPDTVPTLSPTLNWYSIIFPLNWCCHLAQALAQSLLYFIHNWKKIQLSFSLRLEVAAKYKEVSLLRNVRVSEKGMFNLTSKQEQLWYRGGRNSSGVESLLLLPKTQVQFPASR